MVSCDCDGNAFSVKLIMQLGDGRCEIRLLDLGKELVNLGSFSESFPFFLKEDCEHLLHRIKKLAEGKCMLTLVMEG